jgi:hypothetical protein
VAVISSVAITLWNLIMPCCPGYKRLEGTLEKGTKAMVVIIKKLLRDSVPQELLDY